MSRKRKKFHNVRKVLADGAVMFYYYVSKGEGSSFYQSPERYDSLDDAPQEFIDAYSAAKIGIDDAGTFGKHCLDFLQSPKFLRYADATKRDLKRYTEMALDIPLKGRKLARKAPLQAFDRVEIIPYINRWRDSMASTPRQADMAVATLRRILAYGCSQGRLSFNRAENIERLYDAPIDEGAGWSDADFHAFIGGDCPRDLSRAARFIRYFGVRRTDAVSIQRSAIKGDTLVWMTSKGRRKKRQAIAPILPEGRALLDEILSTPNDGALTATTILTNSRGRPWTPDGFSTSFDKRRKKLGIQSTMHDLRAGYATDLVVAHTKRPHVITRSVVCRALGWGEEQLDQMIRVYVDDSKVIDALTNSTGTDFGNQTETEPDLKEEHEA